MSSKPSKLEQFFEAVRFEQTLFALPFAFASMLLAAHGFPSLRTWFWVTLAMFGARTAGMAANRIIDRQIDAVNPRTQDRALPAGRLSVAQMTQWMLGSFGLLLLASYQLNPLCFKLSPLAVALLLLYSYTKRFTWCCHLVLGLVQACAPIGGWLAVTGQWSPTPLALGAAIGLWVGGFDVLYACQDFDHDRSVGLFSIPARFGKEGAFKISRLMHCLAFVLFITVGRLEGLGHYYFGCLGFVASMLWWQHQILKPNDLSRLQQAFFHANVAISLSLLLGVLLEVTR